MCFVCLFSILFTLLGKRELVFVLIVHSFVSYAHVNLCHFFSSSWCRGLSAATACGSSWTFLFTFSINCERLRCIPNCDFVVILKYSATLCISWVVSLSVNGCWHLFSSSIPPDPSNLFLTFPVQCISYLFVVSTFIFCRRHA